MPCSPEQYSSLQKALQKGKIKLDPAIDLIYSSPEAETPSVIQAFTLGDKFRVEIVCLEGDQRLHLGSNDVLVANFSSIGLSLDEFMDDQPFCKEIRRFLKAKDTSSLQEERLLEMDLWNFKVLLQVYSYKDLLHNEKTLWLSQHYLEQVLSQLCSGKKFLNLYYPWPNGFEKKILTKLFKKLVNMRNADDTNYLEIPSKIVFLCGGKQKERVLKIFQECKEAAASHSPSLERYVTRWSYEIKDKRNGKSLKIPFQSQTDQIIEKAHLCGFKSVPILLDESRLQNPIADPEIDEYHDDDTEKLLINLKKMTERSFLTGFERPMTYDPMMEEFLFFDPALDEFVPCDAQLNEVLICLRKLEVNTLIYHKDLELKLIKENAFYVDFDRQVMRPDSRFLPMRVESNHIKEPFYNVSRSHDDKSEGPKKAKRRVLTINEVKPNEELGDSKVSPQLILRTQTKNLDQFMVEIKCFLERKQVTHYMNIAGIFQDVEALLQQLSQKNNLQVMLNNDILSLTGHWKTIRRTLPSVKGLIELGRIPTSFPDIWSIQLSHLQEVDLRPETNEYQQIEGLFLETSKDLQVCSITRIQNRKLWESYELESKRMAVKGNSQQKTLFHGTQLMNPRDVYSGTEYAFQTRQGPLGKAVYFSEDSRDSVQGYEYKVNDGRFAVILAKVLVGKVYDAENDNRRDFNKPPLMTGDWNSSDSVRAGSVFAVYERYRAYPDYVIEYKPKSLLFEGP